jgi:hypothetical protein
MKYIILLLSAFFLTGCCCGGTDSLPQDPPVLYKKIESEEMSWLTAQLAVKWEKELSLKIENSAIYYGNSIHTVRYELTSMAILDVKEARERLVDVVEDILSGVNRNPILSEELFSYPLAPENLEIYIDFKSFYNIYVDAAKVGFISLENGISKFWASDVKNYQFYDWHTRIEPYFRSRETVQLERAAEEQYAEEHADYSYEVMRGTLRQQTPYKTK